MPGVFVAPAPQGPGYHQAGYDIVLDSAGDIKLRVATQVMRLTRDDPKIARGLVEGAPFAENGGEASERIFDLL